MSYGSTLHIPPTNLLVLAAKQESYKKSLSLNEKYWRIFWKKFRRRGQQAENDKTERVTGLGRRTREEIAKWNQMTALRFQTGGDIRHPRPPFGGATARHYAFHTKTMLRTGNPCQDPAGNRTTRRLPDHCKETQTAAVWSCLPFIRSGQKHLARHSEMGKKTRQTEEEVGRQH